MGTNFNFKSFGNDSAADAAAGRPPGGFGLARQTSIYSLTFDELQNTMGGSLGKDFGSMNMDELLKNIWSAEETQSMAAAAAAAAAASSGTAEGLQRQGSLTLPRTLSQKTVDEVWRELSKEYVVSGSGIGGAGAGGGGGGGGGGAGGGGNVSRRQHTLGEITLEEFLVKAGVVREDMPPMGGGVVNNGNNNSNNAAFFGFQQNRGVGLSNNSDISSNQIHIQPSNLPLSVNGVRSNQPQIVQQQQQQQQPQQIFPKQPNVGYMTQMGMQNSPGIRTGLAGIGDQGIGGGGGGGMGMVGLGVVPLGSPANHLMKSPVNQISSDGVAKSNGDLSSVSPVPYPFNGNLRGRRAGGAVEKVVERRQRRMIKNRESAARSRARKQAYTMELEAEIAKLKEENEELRKKQEEIMEMQKNQVMEMMNSQQGSKKRLRRTQTGPW